MEAALAARKAAFKPNLATLTKDKPQSRRVSHDAATSLRRRKAVQAKRRRRLLGVAPATSAPSTTAATPSSTAASPPPLPPPPIVEWTPESLAATLAQVTAGASGTERLAALKQLRVVLSQDDRAIQPCLDGGLLPLLTQLLESGHDEHKLESTWCLANVAVGTSAQTEAVLSAMPQLIELLQCGNATLAEHAAWVVANVAGDECKTYRQRVAAMGGVGALVPLLASKEIPLRKTCLWAMSNLLIGDDTPALPFAKAGVVQPLLATLAEVPPNVECCAHAARCLSFMACREVDVATGLVTMGALRALVPTLTSPDPTLCRSALRAIGNCIGVSNAQVQAAVAIPEFLPNIVRLLASVEPSDPTRKEALWVLSNVTGGAMEHAGAAVTAGAVPLLAQAVSKGTFEVQREAGVALLNLALQHASLLAAAVAEPQVLKAFIGFAKGFDVGLVRLGLTFLEVTLRAHPSGPTLVEEAGGLEALEGLEYRVTHTPLASPPDPKRPDIATWASMLVAECFGEEGGGGGVAPVDAGSAGMGVGISAGAGAGAGSGAGAGAGVGSDTGSAESGKRQTKVTSYFTKSH